MLDQTHFVVCCARKRTPHMAEELAFKKRLNNGRTEPVQRLRNHFLSRSGWTSNQDRSEMRGNAADSRKELPHSRAVADDALELGVPAKFVLQFQCFLPTANIFNGCAEPLAQGRYGNWLVEVIAGAFSDGLYRRFRRIVRCHKNHFNCRIEVDDAFQQFQAAHFWHDQIGEDNVRMLLKDEI